MSDLLRERETTIVFNDDETTASLWSASPRFQKQMERLGISPTKTAQRDGSVSCLYVVPRKWIKVRKSKIYSDEQREKMASQAKASFAKGQP